MARSSEQQLLVFLDAISRHPPVLIGSWRLQGAVCCIWHSGHDLNSSMREL